MTLKPISIAPKNGTRILALTHNALEHVTFRRVRWSNDAWRINDSHVSLPHEESFTLWTDDVIEEESQSPPAPLVPLGPNTQRNGLPVRVICNDRKHSNPNYAVIIVLEPNDDGSERLGYRNQDGSVSTAEERPEDLVRHLPPKPREVWIKHLSVNSIDWSYTKALNPDYRLFREVIQ